MGRLAIDFHDWVVRRLASVHDFETTQVEEGPEGGPDASVWYRVAAWTDLPEGLRCAATYRLMSTMSTRAVSGRWLRLHGNLSAERLDALLALLEQRQVLRVSRQPGATPSH